MSVASLKKVKKRITKHKATITKKVKDYNDDPFVVKKAKAAEAFLKKMDYQQSLINKLFLNRKKIFQIL